MPGPSRTSSRLTAVTAGRLLRSASGLRADAGTEQNEQQVDGGYGGQTGAFNEQAGPGYGTEAERAAG